MYQSVSLVYDSIKYVDKCVRVGLGKINYLGTIKMGYKVTLVGESGCGKTSFLHRVCALYQDGDYNSMCDVKSTIVTCFAAIDIGGDRRMHLWDTSGNSKYRSIMPMYLRNSDAVIIMYDETVWEETKNYWIGYILSIFNNASPPPVVVLLCNKVDDIELFDELDNKVDNDISVKRFPISVKTGLNVKNVVNYVLQALAIREDVIVEEPPIEEPIEKKTTKRRLLSCFKSARVF